MTEFGNLALIDQDAGEENGVAIPLPGVRKGEQRVLRVPVDSAQQAALLPALPGSSSFTPVIAAVMDATCGVCGRLL